jgi:hypothetical protein
MKHCVFLLCACLLLSFAYGQTTAPVQNKSALESEPSGWLNLLADRSMKEWTRVPLAANAFAHAGNISEPSPWSLNAAGDLLSCDGDKSGHEWLRYGPELKNFIIHAEFRYPPVQGETRYNSGVLFRAPADGKTWFQAQATLAGGFLFGNVIVNGESQRLTHQKETENRVKPAGEWNIYEVQGMGDQVTLWVNGAQVDTWKGFPALSGYLGLEAEGFKIEFRNVMLKPLP